MSSTAPSMEAGLSRSPGSWRMALIAALLALLVMLAVTLAWLVGYQVEAAEERRAFEAALREADARCFELATRRETDLCRTTNALRGSPAE